MSLSRQGLVLGYVKMDGIIKEIKRTKNLNGNSTEGEAKETIIADNKIYRVVRINNLDNFN